MNFMEHAKKKFEVKQNIEESSLTGTRRAAHFWRDSNSVSNRQPILTDIHFQGHNSKIATVTSAKFSPVVAFSMTRITSNFQRGNVSSFRARRQNTGAQKPVFLERTETTFLIQNLFQTYTI